MAIVTPYTLDSLASRLVVDIYTTGTGMGPSVTLNTLFGGTYYSFVTTSLSGGTSILTTNNNWTGENVWVGPYSEFTNDVYAPTQVKETGNNLVATCELVNLKLEDYANITTSNTFDLSQSFLLGLTAQSVGTNNVDAQTAVSTLTIGETASSVILKGGSGNLIAVNSAVNMTVKDQTALSNNSNVANTKYVDSAISALSTVYATIASLGSYLTTATAASTYATIASLGSYLTTAAAASTYATIASLSSYLTTAAAASTYATIASLSSYLTTAPAATT
jgi:hypothetical protein